MSDMILVAPAAAGEGSEQTYRGGWATVWALGAFDGNTVALKVRPNSLANWQEALDQWGAPVSFSQEGHAQIAYAARPEIVAVTSGVGVATDVDLIIEYGEARTKLGDH